MFLSEQIFWLEKGSVYFLSYDTFKKKGSRLLTIKSQLHSTSPFFFFGDINNLLSFSSESASLNSRGEINFGFVVYAQVNVLQLQRTNKTKHNVIFEMQNKVNRYYLNSELMAYLESIALRAIAGNKEAQVAGYGMRKFRFLTK